MFKSIKRVWQEARGKLLADEFNDAVMRLGELPPEARLRAYLNYAGWYDQLTQHHGSLNNLSNDARKMIAREILRRAKSKFRFDSGTGYGFALMSMYLESSALPGAQAGTIHRLCRVQLGIARELTAEVDQAIEEETREGLREVADSRSADSGDEL